MVHYINGCSTYSRKSPKRWTEYYRIACQSEKVSLPKTDSATHSKEKVDCHECLRWLIDDLVRRASHCMRVLKTTQYKKPEGFGYPLKRKQKVELPPADPEIIRMIEAGV